MWIVLLGIVVFFSTAAIDWIQAFWLRAYNRRQATRAANLGVLEYAAGLIAFAAFIEASWWLVIPEVLGLWVGTQLAVRRIAREDPKPDDE